MKDTMPFWWNPTDFYAPRWPDWLRYWGWMALFRVTPVSWLFLDGGIRHEIAALVYSEAYFWGQVVAGYIPRDAMPGRAG